MNQLLVFTADFCVRIDHFKNFLFIYDKSTFGVKIKCEIGKIQQ